MPRVSQGRRVRTGSGAEASGPGAGESHEFRFGGKTVHIYRRPDIGDEGSWFFCVYLGAEEGQYRRSLRTRDFKEARNKAEAELLSVLNAVAAGQSVSSLSLKELSDKFNAYQEQRVSQGQIAPATLLNQRSRVKLGCEFLVSKLPAGMKTRITAIDGSLFQEYINWRLERAKSSKSGTIGLNVVRDELLVVRAMFRYGKKQGYCSDRSIPVWDFVVDKEGSKRERISNQDYGIFRTCVKKWESEARGKSELERYKRSLLRHGVLVMANTGLRSGELFGLRNGDLEWRESAQEYVIRIRKETTKVRRERYVVLCATDGGRPDGSVTNYLRRWITDNQLHREPSDFVFSSFSSGAKSAKEVFYRSYQSLRVVLQTKGLEWFDAYHCRHFWITARLLAGEPIHLVAKAAGTSTYEIEKTYSHVFSEATMRTFNQRQVVFALDGTHQVVYRGKVQ